MTPTLQLTPLGHSCVLIEASKDDGTTARILLDPGSLTPDLEPILGLDAILITHAHADHIDPDQIRRLTANGPLPVYGDAGSSRVLEEAGLSAATLVETGASEIAGVSIDVSDWPHESIYPGVPVPADLGYLISGRIFAPGDAFAVPAFPVRVLLLPTGAPWMKLSETIDYMRTVRPEIAVPVHDGGLAAAHRDLHLGLMQKFAPEGTTVVTPTLGMAIDVA